MMMGKIIEPDIKKAIPFRQNTVSGCAYYALANLFNDKRYINDVESLTTGQGTHDMNKRLWEYHPEYFIATIFCTQSNFSKQGNRLIDHLPFQLIEDTSSSDVVDLVKAFFISFKRTETKNHCILVLQEISTGLLHVVDSLFDFVQIMTVQEFIDSHFILEVETIESWELSKGNQSCFFYKSYLSHLINDRS